MKKVIRLTESDLEKIVQKILKEDDDHNSSYYITNQEVYDNGEIEERIFSHEIDGIEYYVYVIYYEGNYYEIEVSDDGINTEVENPNDEALEN